MAVLAAWRWFWPVTFARWVGPPGPGAVAGLVVPAPLGRGVTIAGAAPWYQGRVILPVLGKVTATKYTDRVMRPAGLRAVRGRLRRPRGEPGARVRRPAVPGPHGRSGAVVLEFVRRDALAALVPALPDPRPPDLRALPVGRREDGLPWLVRLHGTHLLIAGATGAGKASLLWGLVRAMFPLMQPGWSGCWPLTRS